jgi:nucleotide-binding universal stress UspA family protein
MFDTVLLAVDGSTCSTNAARVGLGVARAHGADVHAVHAVQPRRRAWDSAAEAEDRRERGEAVLAAVADLAGDAGVTVETHLVEGDPPAAIVETATACGADVVVAGRHGRGNLGERLLGSVAQRVLQRSDVPVLVVPDVERPVADSPDRVLATTDGSDAALSAAPYAAGLADGFDATLHVLSAVDVAREGGLFSAGGVSASYVERLEERAGDRVAAFADAVRETSSVPVHEAVRRGAPHAAIREYVDAEGVGAVVMASRGQSSAAGHLLGSVTDRVLRVVDVPVLVVPA